MFEEFEDIYTLEVNGKEVECSYWSKEGDFTDCESNFEIKDEDLLTDEERDEINDLEWL